MSRIQPAVRTSSRVRPSGSGAVKSLRAPLSSVTNGSAAAAPPISRPPVISRARPTERFHHTEIPIGEPNDVLDVAQYEHIIYRTMCQNELDNPIPAYHQDNISASDRNAAIDAISHIHYRLGLTTNGLYHAIGILNRYMAVKQLPRSNLKLYSCAAIFVASKIEEIYPCTVRDLIQFGNHCFEATEPSFTRSQLFAAEIDLMNTIQFSTTFATPLFFLTQLMRISGQNQEIVLLARYILEVMQTDHRFFSMPSSKQAAVAVMVTRIMKGETSWNSKLAGYTSYSEESLNEGAHWIREDLLEERRPKHRFIRRKYGTEPFFMVSNTRVPSSFV